jgi:hypothetical protein
LRILWLVASRPAANIRKRCDLNSPKSGVDS